MKWMLVTLTGLALLAFACDTDDGSDGTIEPQSTSPISTTPRTSPTTVTGSNTSDAILNQIRPLIARVMNVEQDVIDDVEFENRVLTVTLKQEQTLGGPTDIEEACRELNEAIGFADLRIVIMSTSGSQLEECSLNE